MQHLIETLEAIVEDAEWGLLAGWSRENLIARLQAIRGQVRYAIEEAHDWALICPVEESFE